MRKAEINKRKIIFFVLLCIMTLSGVILFLYPYSAIADIESKTQVLWTEPNNETPKAAIQFTFTSKAAFTTNYPIHAKVEIWFSREDKNDTNVVVHIVKPPAQAFKYPLSDTPEAGLIKISQSGEPRKGELDLEFTSPGSYGFVIFAGSSSYLGNMTVAYAAQDKQVIEISPPETRFQSEWSVKVFGIALIPISVVLAFFGRSDDSKKAPQFILQKFQETVEKPVKSKWSIRILHPDKAIEKCVVLYDGIKLPWWDSETPYYEKTIEASSGGNVRIPIEIERENAAIQVLDGKKVLRKAKFKEIVITK
jgi:hypothetical protein